MSDLVKLVIGQVKRDKYHAPAVGLFSEDVCIVAPNPLREIGRYPPLSSEEHKIWELVEKEFGRLNSLFSKS